MAYFLKYTRTLHSWFGVIALPWVILFGLTGFYLNHPGIIEKFLPLQSYQENTSDYVKLSKPLSAEDAAEIARRYWSDSKMKSVSRATYHGYDVIEFEREAGAIIVVSDTGHYYGKSRLQNKMFAPDGSLENRKIYWAYVFSVFHRTGWLGWSIGTVLADITAIALIIFGFSGLVLWYLPKHKRFKRRLGRMLP